MEERIPPHSDDAERSVLGSVMKNKEALFDVLEILTPDDFYSEIHKEIFSAVRDLNRASSPVDVLTVSEELKKRKTFEMVGGRAYVASLTTMAPSTANASAYAKIIKENAVLRRLIEVSSDIVEKSYRQKTDAAQVLDYAEQGIFDIARMNQKKDFTALKDILWTNMDEIDRMAEQEGRLTGLTTGFADLDARTSGLQKSDLIILAAQAQHGKDGVRAECRAECRDQRKCKSPHLFAGNVERTAGTASAEHRFLCGTFETEDGRSVQRRLGGSQYRHRSPVQSGNIYRRYTGNFRSGNEK